MIEVWKDIPGYEGKYQASDMGRIRSLDRKTAHTKYIAYRKGSVMRQSSDDDGYKVLRLCNGKCKMFKVHRLIATTFIKNPNGYRCINHKDNNPGNNRVDNLEWCTVKQNNQYRDAQGRQGGRGKPRIIGQYTTDGQFIRTWTGINKTQNTTGIKTIKAALSGLQHVAGGYKWKYL